MKGEILRRMSMETIHAEGISENAVQKDIEKDVNDEDDYLVNTIGEFGLWQTIVTITVSLTRVLAVWNMMSISFLAPAVEFICVEFSDNTSITEVINSTCYDNCLKYQYSSVIGRSIIEDFGLICRNAWLARITQIVLMFGLFVGVFIFGWISDRFGRRMAMLQSTFLNGVFMIALPYSPNYIIFTAIRFAIGVATGGSLLICVVQIMEIIGKQYREVAGACCLIPDGLAEASLAGFAYFTSDWQSYTFSYGVVSCFIFLVIWFVPESPRWLVSQGRVDEAIKVITNAANRNNLNTSDITAEITKAVDDLKFEDNEVVRSTYLDFFRSKALVLMTLTVFLMWWALGMCQHGIYQYVSVPEVDPYLAVAIIGLIQILFCPLGMFLSWKFGRRKSTISITVTIAIIMLIIIFIPKGHWPVTVLDTLAFIFTRIVFSIIYVYVSELYPTPMRNMSFAFSAGGAVIGAIIAPFITYLHPTWLPPLIFCAFPIIVGLCCFSLPETKGRNLKDTIKKEL